MKKLILILMSLLGLVGLINATNLNDITISPTSQGTQVLLETDGTLTYREYLSGNNVVIDFYDTDNNLQASAFPIINRGSITGIGIADFSSSNILRVVIETEGLKNYNVVPTRSNLALNIQPSVSSGSFPVWRASESISELEYDNFSYGGLPRGAFTGAGGLISMDLDQADILSVLRAIADYSGRDIIASPGVSGTVTLKLNNVTWWQALQAICHSNGFGISEENGILLVGNQSEFDNWRQAQESAERTIYRVYTLEYTTPDNILPSLQNLISERGQISVDARTNSLVVSDIESRQQAVQDMIGILDKATPQVEIIAKIIDVNTDASIDFGITWGVTGLDFFEYNTQGNVQFGDLNQTEERGRIGIQVGTIQSFANIQTLIDAMERDGKARTIASPHITVLDNTTATILGGKRFGVQVRGSDGSVTIEFYDAGTKLEVTPHVNVMDDINLEIRTELSDVDISSVQSGTPIITTHEAQTTQRVMDGETVALGGFVTETESNSETGIPILKNIPLIGWLFKNHSTSTTQREVLIFITPHIIRPHQVETQTSPE
ncbi:MAG: secretin N-terminal domain-containing protein [bacterium]